MTSRLKIRLTVFQCVVYLLYNSEASSECAYQYDMKNNRVKISCGKGAALHIVDQDGNYLAGHTAVTGNTENTPVIVQLNR